MGRFDLEPRIGGDGVGNMLCVGVVFRQSLQIVLEDEAVDTILVINVTPLISNPIDVMDAVAEVAQDRHKPVLAVMMATEDFYDEMKTRSGHPPVYRFPESAARAISHLSRYARWRRRPSEPTPEAFEVDDEAVATDLRARTRLAAAVEATFDAAAWRATVAGRRVAVIAFVVAGDDAVATDLDHEGVVSR